MVNEIAPGLPPDTLLDPWNVVERRRTSFEIMVYEPTKFATTLCDTSVGKVRRTL